VLFVPKPRKAPPPPLANRATEESQAAPEQPKDSSVPAEKVDEAKPFVLVPPPRQVVVAPPPEDPNEFKLSSDVDLVLLDVSVKSESGGFVSALEKSNFKVYEDKVE